MLFRRARTGDIERMMELVAQARAFLRQAGVDQWQGEYPARSDIEADIAAQTAYVAEEEGAVIAMVAVPFDGEAAYRSIRGAWSTEPPYATIHRMAVDDACKGRGVASFLFQSIDALCLQKGVRSIRSDTDANNGIMNRLLEKNGFTRCGVIDYDGDDRTAYEKAL